MKKLDTSPIATGIAFKPKGGTLLFLQLAYQEAFTALMQGNIGSSYDSTKGYILYGCVNSGSGTTYTISAGAIFFNGEMYLCDGQTFTISGSNVAEGVITTTQYTADADPSVFTDGVSRNVHNIRKIVFQPALAGSGAFDYNNAVMLAYRPQGGIGQIVEWDLPPVSGMTQQQILPTYFNVSTSVGIHPLTLGWQIVPGGKVVIAYLNGDATFGTLGATGGEANHVLTMGELPATGVKLDLIKGNNYTGSSTNEALQEAGNGLSPTGGQTLETVYTYPLGSGTAHNNLQPYIVKLKIKRVS